jgi:hypothetical protein
MKTRDPDAKKKKKKKKKKERKKERKKGIKGIPRRRGR